ncbi:MAG: hypothetical protein RRY40_02145, partial [Oscillospiraceae bacterium]
SKTEVLTAIKDESLSFTSDYKGGFSIFALGGDAHGVYEKDCEYELSDYNLQSASSLGVSNSFCGKETEISVEDGKLLIIFTRQGEYKIGF